MHTIEAFLTVVLCGFVWLTIILSLALAGDVTIFDENWLKGYIEDGRIYERNWNLEKRIKGGKIFDRDWKQRGLFDDQRIYDRN